MVANVIGPSGKKGVWKRLMKEEEEEEAVFISVVNTNLLGRMVF